MIGLDASNRTIKRYASGGPVAEYLGKALIKASAARLLK
jgi:hypothetical protein